MIANGHLGALYGALTPPERARLLATCFRTTDTETLRRVRDSLPERQARHYNRLLHIARRLHSPLVDNLAALLHAAQRDHEALLHLLAQHAHERLAWISMWDVWELVPYPVTEREYERVVALERGRPEPLEAFAWYLVQTDTAEQARADGWRADVVALLEDAAVESEEAAHPQALALLRAAIAHGELPAPADTPEGLALPWGALVDWLEPGRAGYTPYGPDYHVPCVELLGGGIHARLEVRPDAEEGAVRARRERIAAALAGMALLPAEGLPSIHPPASREEREEQYRQMEAVWPWRRLDWRKGIECIGARHAEVRGEWAALRAVLDEIRGEDFAGEDPTPERIRPLLAQVEAAVGEMAGLWAEAGGMLEAGAWPPPPELDEATAGRLRAALRGAYRELDD